MDQTKIITYLPNTILSTQLGKAQPIIYGILSMSYKRFLCKQLNTSKYTDRAEHIHN